jgi:hypothetical protein
MTAATHPAYEQLADLLFTNHGSDPSLQEGRKVSTWSAITLSEAIVVNGNQFIPKGKTIYIETPTF